MGTREGAPHKDREEGSSVALGQHFTDPPHVHSGLTGEVSAATQVQIFELHVLEHRDVTWEAG